MTTASFVSFWKLGRAQLDGLTSVPCRVAWMVLLEQGFSFKMTCSRGWHSCTAVQSSLPVGFSTGRCRLPHSLMLRL